jgi:hypothetical protein
VTQQPTIFIDYHIAQEAESYGHFHSRKTGLFKAECYFTILAGENVSFCLGSLDLA